MRNCPFCNRDQPRVYDFTHVDTEEWDERGCPVKVRVFTRWFVRCDRCYAHGPQTYHSKERAVDLWNGEHND